MRDWKTAFIIFCSLFLFKPALADIYYWVDDQGTQYYTTGLESIPEAYRNKAQQLSLPTSPPVPPEMTPNPPRKSIINIPFKPGSPILVSTKINGNGPITLILDTGSDRTLVAPSTLSNLGISMDNSQRGMLKGATGIINADAIWVNSVEVGDVKVGPALIIAHDAKLKGADGLLGRDFLANFDVRIDSKEGVVTLTPN
ncbi:MAG: aspartyl protease family protein [Thermodesulfobacteriota bacterium]